MAKNAPANAERVRENQRRSRARKREYVTTLEERLRRCHQEGVKANVRLQEAAQRVVNENRGLRKLLRQRGLSDQEIQAQLSTTEAETPSASNCRESHPPRPALDTSQTRSTDSPESPFMDEAWAFGEGSQNLFDLDAMFAPPGVDSLWDLASEINLSSLSTPPFLPTEDYTPLLSSTSAPSEMDICCSSVLPSHTTNLSPPGEITGSLPPSPSTASTSSYGSVTGDRLSSTPCTLAYALLAALNSRSRQQQDMLHITLELLNGFRAAPDGDPEGCRVDNNVLIPVMGKLLAI